ncbi:MAG: MurR/RpiR family transcriptional regulator [Bryobacterales bacterium]|nr:MurR/RpiR family transcriptional regulator [Bryobacterales bacterium]
MQPKMARRGGANDNGNLAVRIVSLSARRQRIIRPVLANPRQFVLLRVRDLAKELDTDAATIVRIVRGMGFENYRAFQHHLHEASVAYATSLDTMQASVARKNGGALPVRGSMDQDLKNLNAVRGSVNWEEITKVARLLHASKRVFIFGGDVAASLVTFLEYNLSVVGLPVFAGTGHGRILHLARSVKKSDLVIAISFRRGLRMTVEGLKKASANGAYCVGIADTLLSPLARFANTSFIAPVETPSFGVSYVAPMALLNALIAAFGNVHRTRTLALLREVDEEQRHGSRWYTD